MDPSDCRVLVVDDNEDNAISLAMILESERFNVRVEYDGPRALVALAQFRPHAALLDIGLPGLSGYALARHARELFGSNVLLVAVSGWGTTHDIKTAFESGFDRHFTKPTDPFDLVRVVAEQCLSKAPC